MKEELAESPKAAEKIQVKPKADVHGEPMGESQEKPKDEDGLTLLIRNVDTDVIDAPEKLFDFLGVTSDEIASYRFRSIPFEPKFQNIPLIGMQRKKFLRNMPCNLYVVFKRPAALAIALQHNCSIYENRHLFMSAVGGSRSHKMIPFARLNSVYVGRLPHSWTEEHLYELFSQIGHITNIRLVRDSFTHESKKFAYVEFETKASVKVAIRKLHKSEVKPGHQLNVEVCQKVTQMRDEKVAREERRLEKKAVQKVRPKTLSKNAKRKLAYKDKEAQPQLTQRENIQPRKSKKDVKTIKPKKHSKDKKRRA